MANELMKTSNKQLAVGIDGGNGYAAFARSAAVGVIGIGLKFVKGGYYAGDNEDEVMLGARFLVDMSTMAVGWKKWADGELVDAQVNLVSDNVPLPRRARLGDMDKEAWPIGSDGEPHDPWSRDARVLLYAADEPFEPHTFKSGSWGAQLAFRELCGAYVAECEQHPGQMPIIELAAYKRVDKNYGRIDTPQFPIVGWSSLDELMAPAKKVGKKTKKAVSEFGRRQ
jgi:hypothetical protein